MQNLSHKCGIHLCIVALDALTPASVCYFPQILGEILLENALKAAVIPDADAGDTYHTFSFHSTFLDIAICQQPAYLAKTFCGLPSLWRMSLSTGHLSSQHSSP
ncbi:hypothetical protein CRENBAI_011306 [Crenichthys baileyi]|uniref:Uncharacterized protein n=1 Tax=Crenichthys baileyi TaxID=28760 RepID=A0AAV9RJZ5_9TELE